MAKGKKTGGRDFKPGWEGGPGAPTIPEDVKQSRKMNRIEFERVLQKYVGMSGVEINSVIQNKQTPILEGVVAKILAKAFNDGDSRRLEFILDRLIGKPKEINYDITMPANTNAEPGIKTFDEFCVDAGYPTPYEKQNDMREFAFNDGDPRILLGFRGSGKTDYVTILGVAYEIYCDWFHKKFIETNLIITKSKTRNTAIIQEIGSALKRNGVELEKENSNFIRVSGLQGKDHSAEVLTIKSSFRGRHPKRIIMDDPVTEEDTSEAMRVLVKKKYDEAYKLCNNIVIIGQPAHAYDLYAELRPVLKKLEIPHGQIPELSVDLDSMRLCGVDPHSIEMSYHLRIPTEGHAVFGNIKFIDKFANGDSICFVDPSDGGDYTAITILKGYLGGVMVQGHCWKKAWFHCIDEMVPILKLRGVRKLRFETNCTGSQPIEQLRSVLKPLGIGVDGVHSDTNKHAVICAAGSYSHLIHMSKESDRVYSDMVVKYEYKAKYDDAPDSLARCLEWVGLIRGKRNQSA